jgi:hypothetical protein
MRKIEAQMVMAVRDQLSGSEKTWRSGNTEVTTEHSGVHGTADYCRRVVVRLHDNVIARFDTADNNIREARGLEITDAGWQTVTTKSRLNALLDCFYGGQGINQVKGVWLLNSTRFVGTDWLSYGWRDNWHCQQAEAITKPAVKASGSVYDVEWHRAMASTLAMAKVAATATVLA